MFQVLTIRSAHPFFSKIWARKCTFRIIHSQIQCSLCLPQGLYTLSLQTFREKIFCFHFLNQLCIYLYLDTCFLYYKRILAFINFLKDFIHLCLDREEGREGGREGEKHQCGCLSLTPYWGPGLQPRHVP